MILLFVGIALNFELMVKIPADLFFLLLAASLHGKFLPDREFELMPAFLRVMSSEVTSTHS